MNYGICTDGNVLTDATGNPLTNFSVRVEEIYYEAENEDSPGILHLNIRHRGKSYRVDLDLQNPQLFQQIQQAIPTCKILYSKWKNLIEAYILELFPDVDEELSQSKPLCFRQHGFHKLADGAYVYVAGDEVLGLPKDRKRIIIAEAARPHLVWDHTLSPTLAVRGLVETLTQNSEVLLLVWAFTILSAMRSVLNNINITTYPACSITGGQGLGKTTTCQRFSLLYDDTQRPGRRWGEIDAKSTESATIEVISRYRDQVVLLDDIAKSISQSQVRERKELLAGVLRFACNDSDQQKMNRSGQVVEHSCTAGLIYTGEFPLDNPSDISRTITVSVRKQLQGGKQQDRTLAATAFRWFVLWLLPRTDEVVDGLAKELEQISGTNQRLQKNRMMLLWVLQHFLFFAQVSGAVTEQEVDETMARAVQICDDMVREQIRQSEQLEPPKNLSWYILDGIQRGTIQRISEKNLLKDKQLPEYRYVHRKHDESIYITTDVLYRYFSEQTPIRLSSPKAMNQRLKNEGLIYPTKEGKAASKKINGQRYLELHRVDLMDAANRELQ